MRRRGSIPAQYWNSTVASAARRSINGVGLQQLADAIAVTTVASRVNFHGPEVVQ